MQMQGLTLWKRLDSTSKTLKAPLKLDIEKPPTKGGFLLGGQCGYSRLDTTR